MVEALRSFMGLNINDPKKKDQASEWVYEFNFGLEQPPRGPFSISKLQFEQDRFFGEGIEDGNKFEFIGYIDQKKRFEVSMTFITTDRHSEGNNKKIKGSQMSDSSLVGKWKYNDDQNSLEYINGEFVIRKINNYQYSLHEECPEFLKMKLDVLKCKCNAQLLKLVMDIDQEDNKCTICRERAIDNYYSCGEISDGKQCKFILCNECFLKLTHLKKSELITKIINSNDRSDMTSNIEYIRGIYRAIFSDKTIAQKSLAHRQNRDYRWFEVYQLDEETLQFKAKEKIELYIDQKKFAEGHFHEVKQCKQLRCIKETINKVSGKAEYREVQLEPPINWVFKSIKNSEHITEVPNDIAKQYLALTLSNYFNEILKKVYPQETVYLRYVQPYLVLPLFKPENNLNFFEMESYMDTDVRFEYFNRPGQDLTITDAQLGQARLPSAFTHWCYAATDRNFMITDVQGWRVDKGQYVMTDPIVFSPVPDQLGLVDWGSSGMDNWMRKHKCNEVCKALPMVKDKVLIDKCMLYLRKFRDDQYNFTIQLETILDSFRA